MNQNLKEYYGHRFEKGCDFYSPDSTDTYTTIALKNGDSVYAYWMLDYGASSKKPPFKCLISSIDIIISVLLKSLSLSIRPVSYSLEYFNKKENAHKFKEFKITSKTCFQTAVYQLLIRTIEFLPEYATNLEKLIENTILNINETSASFTQVEKILILHQCIQFIDKQAKPGFCFSSNAMAQTLISPYISNQDKLIIYKLSNKNILYNATSNNNVSTLKPICAAYLSEKIHHIHKYLLPIPKKVSDAPYVSVPVNISNYILKHSENYMCESFSTILQNATYTKIHHDFLIFPVYENYIADALTSEDIEHDINTYFDCAQNEHIITTKEAVELTIDRIKLETCTENWVIGSTALAKKMTRIEEAYSILIDASQCWMPSTSCVYDGIVPLINNFYKCILENTSKNTVYTNFLIRFITALIAEAMTQNTEISSETMTIYLKIINDLRHYSSYPEIANIPDSGNAPYYVLFILNTKFVTGNFYMNCGNSNYTANSYSTGYNEDTLLIHKSLCIGINEQNLINLLTNTQNTINITRTISLNFNNNMTSLDLTDNNNLLYSSSNALSKTILIHNFDYNYLISYYMIPQFKQSFNSNEQYEAFTKTSLAITLATCYFVSSMTNIRARIKTVLNELILGYFKSTTTVMLSYYRMMLSRYFNLICTYHGCVLSAVTLQNDFLDQVFASFLTNAEISVIFTCVKWEYDNKISELSSSEISYLDTKYPKRTEIITRYFKK